MIESLKDLKNLLKLCQSQGVKSIEIEGIKLELSQMPKTVKQKRSPGIDLALPPEALLQIPQMEKDDREPSEEELLMWSADAHQ